MLLVEDDPDDAALMRAAMAGGRGLAELVHAGDGHAALERLRGLGPFGRAPRPVLVLLDWRLPGMSGAEVLGEIRSDRALRRLPVLVLTTSASARDVDEAYELGANAYLTKPTGAEEMRGLAALIEDFWLGRVRLPGGGAREEA